MKYWLFTAQWIVLATALHGAQQKVAPPKSAPPPSGNRYLFVVETSALMTHFEHAGRQSVFDLIFSGADGRMRRGDTYGVWTFNEEVFAGQFPMQIWQGDKSALNHASNVGRFLKAQAYQKTGRPENVFKHLGVIARAAKDVNVFIISEGAALVAGTPFDAQINAAYATNLLQPAELRKPLITTVTIRNGQFTSACVTPAGEPIQLADLPMRTRELELAKAMTSESPAAPKAQPLGQVVAIGEVEDPNRVSTNGAIIMRNTNAKPVSVDSTTSALVAAPEPKSGVTNEFPKAELPNPVVGPAVLAPAPADVARVPDPNATIAPVAVAAPATNDVPVTRPEPLPSTIPAVIRAEAREVNAMGGTGAPPGMSNLTFILMLVFGGAFVGGALVFAIFWIRRWRATPQTSFISRGMDRY